MRFLISLCVPLLLLVKCELSNGQTLAPATSSSDPCYIYTIINDFWRDFGQNQYYQKDDNLVDWNGWYRFYLNGTSAQMSEWCVSFTGCGGETALFLSGSHPKLEDGVVTREVSGNYLWNYYNSQCGNQRLSPIQVKACPGHYYVYKLVTPDMSIRRPSYCAVTFNNNFSDPCYNYESLDRPWRASNESGFHVCEDQFSWNGWYRLFYNGMNIRMPESCVSPGTCNTYYSLWLNGPHPQIEDGVVIREVCSSSWSGCCNIKSTPIRVKACPGDYFVYELVKPTYRCSGYCTDVGTTSSVTFTTTPAHFTGSDMATSAINTYYDPCYKYSILDDDYRSVQSFIYGYNHDDTRVKWEGWYRFFINGSSAQMLEGCFSYMTCGGFSALWLGGPHPKIQDGIVTREVYGSIDNRCSFYTSNPIQVKACPGNFYVYKLTRPKLSIIMPVYCTVAIKNISSDPCYNYESLDRPWRASNESGLYVGDGQSFWNGWYRLFYNGMNIRMSDSCVSPYSCNTHYSLWLNGPHPQIEDGVVIREICMRNSWGGCCDYKSQPIRVKACPGNYYVYEFVKPQPFIDSGYCTDISTLSQFISSTSPAPVTESSFTLSTIDTYYDPCYKYSILDDDYRSVHSFSYEYNHDDTRVKWEGWYRFFINGSSAQMPEGCFSYMSCGGFSALWLGGPHPKIQDGIVTREVYGSVDNRCSFYTSNPIQVKACPGNYYVYKLTRPKLSIIMPVYCTVAFKNISSDPCYNYESLDRPWRASNESGLYISDGQSWNGWYRLFYNGMNIRMPESCVSAGTCNTYYSLWLNGPHPQIEDGVVIREICGRTSWGGCCDYKSQPIRVKACSGDYYVYEFVKSQPIMDSGYCTDINTLSQFISSTSPALLTESSLTLSAISSDPCSDYHILKQSWRSTIEYWNWNGYDDTRVKWEGWYRFFINGSSAQMPEWCFSYMTCGGFSSLWLGGPHPKIQDGIVTREVYGTQHTQCSYYKSNSIKVKACPGNYYVYKLIKPNLVIPIPSYCAVPFSTPRIDPCYNYTTLNDPRRSTNFSYIYSSLCDYDVNWDGWYRLLYKGLNAQMPESCVSSGMCGSYSPLWLNGSHPRLEDGVVFREVCSPTWNDCCGFKSHPIQVKACPGNYFVYQFVKPLYCGVYCADHTSFHTPSPSLVTNPDPCSHLNCTENELCRKHNGVYGCFCNQTHPTSNPDTFDAYETCESSSGFMSLSRCQLFEAGFSADVLHLNDPSCRGTVQNGRVEFRFDNNGHICGTGLVANGTHIIYENFIFGQQGSVGGVISRKKFLKLRFNCVYFQAQSVSMDINPLESIVHRNIQGLGTYKVRMISYQDAQFSKPFSGSVSVEVDQRIFVEVRVDGVDDHQFSSVIDSCWATPVNDPQSSLRWDLIAGECPNPNDETVELLQNGVSSSSRFSFKMFIFTANSTKVYLHCKIHLCLLANNTCSSPCYPGHHQRKRRSLDFHDTAAISMGPLVWSEGNSDIVAPKQVKVSKASGLCGSLMLLLVLVLSAYNIF